MRRVAIGGAVVFAVVVLILAGRSRRPPVVRDDSEPSVQRTIAVFLILDSTLNNTAAREAMAKVAARLETSNDTRVVDAWIRPTADVEQLENVLNATASIEAHPLANNALEVLFRQGDSVRLRRSYQFATTGVDSILADAATMLGVGVSPSPTHAPSTTREWYLRLAVADSLAKRGDTAAARRAFVATIVSAPQAAWPRYRYAEFLFAQHHVAESLRQARRAHELDPLSSLIHLGYATLLERSGRAADAAREREEQKRIATILNPGLKDRIARARFKHVPKRPPRPSRSARPRR